LPPSLRRNNQATIITPFILAGAMAPTTSAGVAAQTLAESLAGATFTQRSVLALR
jgi:trimethylamine--corrinoid protein Co-methyltransferase